MIKMKWLRYGEPGYVCEVGSIVRWRDVQRGPWQYAYWRGQDDARMMTFSLTPSGPIFMWSLGFDLGYQVACLVPEPPASQSSGRADS